MARTTLSNGKLTAVIDSKGAELVSLKNENGKEYIWEGNPQFWGKHSPVLFPIVGTLKNNQYSFEGKTYHLLRHGFARDLEFSIAKQSAASVTFALSENENTLSVYPFRFELRLVYTLLENRLEIRYEIVNRDTKTMYFSIGAHPAFALPGSFTAYAIEVESGETLEYHLLENDLLSDKTAAIPLMDRKFQLDYGLFKNDALVFKTIQPKSLTILQHSQPMLKVRYDDFASLGIWTKENAPFVCIEPWLGYADTVSAGGELSEKEGILALPNNSQFDAKFYLEVF